MRYDKHLYPQLMAYTLVNCPSQGWDHPPGPPPPPDSKNSDDITNDDGNSVSDYNEEDYLFEEDGNDMSDAPEQNPFRADTGQGDATKFDMPQHSAEISEEELDRIIDSACIRRMFL